MYRSYGKVIFPTFQSDGKDYSFLHTDTSSIKNVADYTGLNFSEVLCLDCYTFTVLHKDSIIHRMSQTKEGREALENSYILQSVSADRNALREKFKGGV